MIRQSFAADWFVATITDGVDGAAVGPISVPHDAMLFETRDGTLSYGHNTGYYPGGDYRYTKTFEAPAQWGTGRVVLEFEGVYRRSEVRLNGALIGGRPYGYSLFHVDLTPHLRFGERNVLEVIARNSEQPNSRWYTGSGIFRPVTLLVGGAVHVEPLGLRITTTRVDGQTAEIEIATEITNSTDSPRNVTVTAMVRDASGRERGVAYGAVQLLPGVTAVSRLPLSIPDAALWSSESPSLHVAEVTVNADGEVIDVDRATFGIRTITADSVHGLRINGETVTMRGAAIHHDNGVIGAHTLDAAEDRRVRILKESGYNAIRSAHNPLAPATLRACDKYGVLVMDELSDTWWRAKGAHDYSHDFLEWWERDLTALVRKDYNHPSVVLYSLGNELAETASRQGVELSARMVALVRELDSTRLTTNAINGFVALFAPTNDPTGAEPTASKREKSPASERDHGAAILVANLLIGTIEKVMHGVARLAAVDRKTRDIHATVDVAGYNYMHRRYEMDAIAYPDRVIVGSETQATQTSEIWRIIEKLPNVIGDFVWTGWDYIGEVGIGAPRYDDKRRLMVPFPARLAGLPIIDITGHRQTQSYVNEIIWRRRTDPVLAVRPLNHSHQKRVPGGWRGSDSIRSWSWEGFEGRPAIVEVYADAARVELQLDDVTIGSRTLRDDDDLLSQFRVPYRAGTLTAIAFDRSGAEIGRDTLISARTTLRITARSEVSSLRADSADLAYIPIELTDESGIVRPLADRTISVTVSGAGTLLGLGSADPMSPEGFVNPTCMTYYGRALAVVRAGTQPGSIDVRIEAQGCSSVALSVPVGVVGVGASTTDFLETNS